MRDPLRNNFEESRIGIVLATYNPNLKFFKLQIDSIVNQSFNNWHCLVTDDCSDPDFYSEICKIVAQDSRFQVVSTSQRVGILRNFENGLLNLQGRFAYYCFCDQDDVWNPNKLEVLAGELNNDPDSSLIHSDATIINEVGEVIDDSLWGHENRKNFHSYYFDLILRNNVTGCTTMFTREVAEMSLPFPAFIEGNSMFHDQWVAINASLKGKIKNCSLQLIQYRVHGENAVGPQKKKSISLLFNVKLLLKVSVQQWNLLNSIKRLILERHLKTSQNLKFNLDENETFIFDRNLIKRLGAYLFFDFVRFSKFISLTIGGIMSILKSAFCSSKGVDTL